MPTELFSKRRLTQDGHLPGHRASQHADDQAIVKLLDRLKGKPEAAEETVFDFAAPVPIGPEAAPGVAKRETAGGEADEPAVLDLSTINFGD